MKSRLLPYRIVWSLRLLFPIIGHLQSFPALLWQKKLTVLLTTVMLATNLLAQAQVDSQLSYDNGTVGFFPTVPVVDSRGNGKVTSVPSPLGGIIGFSDELDIFSSVNAPSWGNGYSGNVYANSRISSITLTLPANTKAFYLFARANYFPNLSGQTGSNVTATATTQNGHTVSATQRVAFGDTEAKCLAFYVNNATNDSDNLKTITVTLNFPGANLYIGQFGIYQCDPTPTRLLASNNGVLTCTNPTLELSTPDAVSFYFSYAGPNGFYTGGISGNGRNAIISDPGTYTATVNFVGGCPAIGTVTITEDKNPPTNVTFTNGGPLTCKKPAVTIRASSTNGYTYDFSGPNGFKQNGTAPTASVTTPGSYALYVRASNGCPASLQITDVTADSAPPADLTLTNSGTITCSQPTVQLTAASSTTNVTYSFSGPGITKTNGNMATVNQEGTYQVTAMSTNGCTTVASTTVALKTNLTSLSQPLIDLYNATGGTNWTHKDNWLTTCDVCGWYGVTCDGNGRITRLNLINNNLSGTLPTSLSTLTSLQSLELGANALTGGIPTGIGSLTALQTLNLSRTQLGGSIPTTLGQLTRLQNLFLNESGLTGTLPANLGNLTQLQNLQLYTNQLSGCFPASYTALCGRSQINFTNNPGLPGGGDFGTFCTKGAGSELVVSQYPQSGKACVGSTFSFSVVARGAGSYQWYKFGPRQGEFQRLAESGPVLSFSSVSTADAGTYQVYINYACRPGAIQSDYVTLTVPQPGTEGCTPANTPPIATANASQTATVGRAFSYTVNAFTDAQTPNSLTYSASINPANGLSFDATTRVLSGTPSQPEPVSVTITATDAGGLSASTSFSINVGPRVVSSTPLRVTLTASPQTVLTSGSTVLRATASGGNLGPPPSGYTYIFSGPGDFATSQANEVTVTNLPAGVQTFAVIVSDASTPTSQTTSATVSVTVNQANTAPTVASAIPAQSATVGQAFSYLIPAGTFTDAQTPNSLVLSVSGLPQGLRFTAPATLSGTPSVSGTSTVTVTVTDPGSLTVSTSFELTVTAPAAPVLTTQPAAGSSVCTGASVRISVTASGSGNLTYQWYKDGSLLSGQTSATLTLDKVTATQGGSYQAVISNGFSSTTSTAFSLIVNPIPVVNISASSTAICMGQVATLTASGGASYRWNTGQITQSISVTSTSSYAVTATNASGCSASATASVTVKPTPPAPAIITQSGQLYPGGQSSVTVPQYSGTVTLLISGCSGTINWQNTSGSSGSSTSISVATTTPATYVYQATCQQAGCPSAPASATVIVQRAPLRVVTPLLDCASGKLTLRTTGGNGQSIEYHIPSVTNGWDATNPVSVQAKDYRNSLRLQARQRSVEKGGFDSDELNYQLPACPGARIAAPALETTLSVVVLGNPVVGESVEVLVGGVAGQAVEVIVTDLAGHRLYQQSIAKASGEDRVRVPVWASQALTILKVSTATQHQTIKLIRQ